MNISVIIPVYNAENFVAKAIESALQFPEVKEVLLIEDASPDNALQVCQKLEAEHDRVKLFQHSDKGNHGAGASRNLGLENASCPFIAFLDADDFYLPNRFSADKKILLENLSADFIYNAIGAHYYSAEAEAGFKGLDFHEVTTVREPIDSTGLFESFIRFREGVGYFSLDGLTIRRHILSRMNYWFNPELRLHQDSEFIHRLTYYATGMAGEISEPVAIRGVHDHNRITAARRNPVIRDKHQTEYWISMYNWAVKEDIPTDYQRHILKMLTLYLIRTKSGLARLGAFISALRKEKSLFIQAQYYNSIHFELFGYNFLSKAVLKFKLIIQKFL